jgi:hypothetical protein
MYRYYKVVVPGKCISGVVKVSSILSFRILGED